MAVQVIEGFKFRDLVTLSLTDSASGTSKTFSRVPGRGLRYGLSYSADSTLNTSAYAGCINLPHPASGQYCFGFAGWQPPVTTPTAISNSYIGIYFTGTFYDAGVSIDAGRNVGTSFFNGVNMSGFTFPAAGVTTSGWHWWCVSAIPNSSATGYLRIYRDGVLCAEAAPDTNESPNGSFTGVRIYMGNSAATTAPSHMIVSDFIYRDDAATLIPDSRVDCITLASTTTNQWTGSDGDSVSNHLLLNDAGPTVDAANYVEAAAVGKTDTYTLSTIPTGIGTVHAVKAYAVGASADSAIATKLAINSTDSTAINPIAGTTITNLLPTNPATSQPWTLAEVQAATVSLKT